MNKVTLAAKVTMSLDSGLDKMETRYGVSKSLILRQTLAALLESVPSDRLCRLDITDLTGPALISVRLDGDFADELNQRFPAEAPGEVLKFAAQLAVEVFARETQLCLPLGLSLGWPKSGVLRAHYFAAVVPGVRVSSIVKREVFMRGKSTQCRWYSAHPPAFDFEGKVVKGYLR